ncbi:MAG: hypothetical protein RL323_2317 [Pseudomonadota bacterium]|jgi:hypothetical protein
MNAAQPDPLGTFPQQLANARAGQIPLAHFCDWARGQTSLTQRLPPAFETVLVNLLDRLESSALFAEESCSFSQTDLWDSLQMWVDKARTKLQIDPLPNQ